MALTEFPIPGIHYFVSDNSFCGSLKGFNYHISPVKSSEDNDERSHFAVFTWYGELCSDLSDKQAEESFLLDSDGLQAMTDWLREQYTTYRAEH